MGGHARPGSAPPPPDQRPPCRLTGRLQVTAMFSTRCSVSQLRPITAPAVLCIEAGALQLPHTPTCRMMLAGPFTGLSPAAVYAAAQKPCRRAGARPQVGEHADAPCAAIRRAQVGGDAAMRGSSTVMTSSGSGGARPQREQRGLARLGRAQVGRDADAQRCQARPACASGTGTTCISAVSAPGAGAGAAPAAPQGFLGVHLSCISAFSAPGAGAGAAPAAPQGFLGVHLSCISAFSAGAGAAPAAPPGLFRVFTCPASLRSPLPAPAQAPRLPPPRAF